MTRDHIKTTLQSRKDGRRTTTIKLIGWTDTALERLIFELGGPAGYEIGSTIRRALDIEKDANERGLPRGYATIARMRRIP